jgi:hypothetical protein
LPNPELAEYSSDPGGTLDRGANRQLTTNEAEDWANVVKFANAKAGMIRESASVRFGRCAGVGSMSGLPESGQGWRFEGMTRSPRFASTVIQKTLYRAAIKNQTNTTPELSAISTRNTELRTPNVKHEARRVVCESQHGRTDR